jgi:hypothetical protein
VQLDRLSAEHLRSLTDELLAVELLRAMTDDEGPGFFSNRPERDGPPPPAA